MTDSTEPQESEPDAAAIEKYWDERIAAQPDQLLSAYVHAIGPGDGGQTVTLALGGVVVSGTMVHRIDWMKSLLAERPGLRPSLDGIVEDWQKNHDADLALSADDPKPPYATTVHLVDAHILTGGHPIPSWRDGGMHWRGLLSAVDGWSLEGFGAPKKGDESEAEDPEE